MPIKYLMLHTGELYIRNVTKLDAGSYKCIAKSRLTGLIESSKVGAQLMIDGKYFKQQLKLFIELFFVLLTTNFIQLIKRLIKLVFKHKTITRFKLKRRLALN